MKKDVVYRVSGKKRNAASR